MILHKTITHIVGSGVDAIDLVLFPDVQIPIDASGETDGLGIRRR